MNTISLTWRARTRVLLATAGLVTVAGTLTVAGSAGAGEPLRMTVTSTAVCSANGTPQGVDLFYDDHTDGHVPQSVEELVVRGSSSGGIEEWSGGGLYQEGGNYFNRRTFSDLGIEIDPSATYTYWVTIFYDDGVSQTGSATVDLAAACGGTAPSTTVPVDDAPRFEQSVRTVCGSNGTPIGIEVAYDDLVDGHVPQAVHEELVLGGGGVVWSSDELHQVNGDYFNRRQLSAGELATFDPHASYGYWLAITYDDGVQRVAEVEWVAGSPSGGCTASPTTTTVPSGTLPETGSGNLTWAIGAVGGLFSIAGAALLAGMRRSRIS